MQSLVQEPSEKPSLRKRSLVQGAWGLEIPHVERSREGVLDKKKQSVQKAKKAKKSLSLVSQSQSVAQMKGMWVQLNLGLSLAETPRSELIEYENTRGSDPGQV